jgi:hypothetical protein
MSLLIFGLCIGLIPALVISLVISNKSSQVQTNMHERLAAVEASKRHFIDLATKRETTIALMHQELKRLEVELAHREGAFEQITATAA